MNVSAFAGGALLCVVVVLLVCPFIPEISAGVRAVIALRPLRGAIALFGHLFLGATWVIDRALAVITAWRKSAARPICAIALSAALAAAAIAGAVSAAYASPLSREPGDVAYLPSLAIRADGRLALADRLTITEAARAYAGPRDYWAAACRATLPGWRWPIDWHGSDAIGRTLWRATVSDRGAVTVDGLAPAEAASMRALLEAPARAVTCAD